MFNLNVAPFKPYAIFMQYSDLLRGLIKFSNDKHFSVRKLDEKQKLKEFKDWERSEITLLSGCSVVLQTSQNLINYSLTRQRGVCPSIQLNSMSVLTRVEWDVLSLAFIYQPFKTSTIILLLQSLFRGSHCAYYQEGKPLLLTNFGAN